MASVNDIVNDIFDDIDSSFAPREHVSLVRTIYSLHDSVLKQTSNKVYMVAQKVVYQLGREARDKARALCPKRTGALAASIYVSKPGANAKETGGTYTKQSAAGYFRAVNAVVRRNPKALGLVHPSEIGEGGSFNRQRLGKIDGEGQTLLSKGTYGGNVYQVYSRGQIGDFSEARLQSVLPFQGGTKNSFFVAIGAAAYYAAFVEFGAPARGARAQPFLGPAVEWAKLQLPGRLKAALAEGGLS